MIKNRIENVKYHDAVETILSKKNNTKYDDAGCSTLSIQAIFLIHVHSLGHNVNFDLIFFG